MSLRCKFNKRSKKNRTYKMINRSKKMNPKEKSKKRWLKLLLLLIRRSYTKMYKSKKKSKVPSIINYYWMLLVTVLFLVNCNLRTKLKLLKLCFTAQSMMVKWFLSKVTKQVLTFWSREANVKSSSIMKLRKHLNQAKLLENWLYFTMLQDQHLSRL